MANHSKTRTSVRRLRRAARRVRARQLPEGASGRPSALQDDLGSPDERYWLPFRLFGSRLAATSSSSVTNGQVHLPPDGLGGQRLGQRLGQIDPQPDLAAGPGLLVRDGVLGELGRQGLAGFLAGRRLLRHRRYFARGIEASRASRWTSRLRACLAIVGFLAASARRAARLRSASRVARSRNAARASASAASTFCTTASILGLSGPEIRRLRYMAAGPVAHSRLRVLGLLRRRLRLYDAAVRENGRRSMEEDRDRSARLAAASTAPKARAIFTESLPGSVVASP
jgi:hypothetical protein